jgi:hypothetical protein
VKSEEERQLLTPRQRMKDNIKWCLKEPVFTASDWIELPEDGMHLLALMNLISFVKYGRIP